MQLTGPYKLRLSCDTAHGGSVTLTREIDDGDASLPFLLSLFGPTKKRDNRQLELWAAAPDHGEVPETAPLADGVAQEQAPAADQGQPDDPTAGGAACPDCGSPEISGTTDPDTGAAGWQCDECNCRFGFTCTEPGCDGPAGRAGKCDNHQPKDKPKRKRASSRRKPAATGSVCVDAENCIAEHPKPTARKCAFGWPRSTCPTRKAQEQEQAPDPEAEK